jgi:predicted Zn finger-like uncharacterized protein
MSDQIRYNVAIAAARELLQRLGYKAEVDEPDLADRLSQAAYTVLEAIYAAETQLADYECQFVCPKCLHSYRIHNSFRGREVRCVECGYEWRAPDLVEPN